jgi:carboxylate-amine ligase
MDAQPVPEDSAALAGLVQTMMVDAGQRWDEGERWTADRFITAENRWLALRHGLEARLVDPVTGAAVDARTLLERLLDRLAPAAAQVDAGWALARVADIAAAGGAAQAQVDRYRSVADLVAVTRWLADLAVPSP